MWTRLLLHQTQLRVQSLLCPPSTTCTLAGPLQKWEWGRGCGLVPWALTWCVGGRRGREAASHQMPLPPTAARRNYS